MSENSLVLDSMDRNILKYIRQHSNVDRVELGNALGVSYPTINRAVSELVANYYIDGRTLSISKECKQVFWGVSFGTSHIKICLINLAFELIDKNAYRRFFDMQAEKTGIKLVEADSEASADVCEGILDKYLCYHTPPKYDEFVSLLNLILDSIIWFTKEYRKRGEYITSGIGFAFSGAVDKVNGILKKAINIEYLEDVSLRQIIPPSTHHELVELGIPLVFDHNAKAAAVSEKEALFQRTLHGYEEKKIVGRNMLCFYLGTGIGAGLILDNRLYTGTYNFAGEISHFPVFFSIGETNPLLSELKDFYSGDIPRICSCGNINCFERYVKILDEFLRDVASVAEADEVGVFDLSKLALLCCSNGKKDSTVDSAKIDLIIKGYGDMPDDAGKLQQYLSIKIERAYRMLGHLIGHTITALVNILNIDTVVCTGRLTRYYKRIERYILEQTAKNGVSYTRNCCTVLNSVHGKLAPAVGIAIEAFYSSIGDTLDWNIIAKT